MTTWIGHVTRMTEMRNVY